MYYTHPTYQNQKITGVLYIYLPAYYVDNNIDEDNENSNNNKSQHIEESSTITNTKRILIHTHHISHQTTIHLQQQHHHQQQYYNIPLLIKHGKGTICNHRDSTTLVGYFQYNQIIGHALQNFYDA